MTKIQNAALLELLPFNVRDDNIEIQSLSYAIQQAMSMMCRYADGVKILSAVDTMPMAILDSLAIELNIPCYDSTADIKVKRALVKDAFLWHRSAGTVSALKKYLSTISDNISIQEWYDYNGEPYHFRIEATVPEEQEISTEAINDISQQISKLKNARSVLDEALIVKDCHRNISQGIAIGTAHIVETSLGEYEPSSYWIDSDILLTAKNENIIYCDKNGNPYTI